MFALYSGGGGEDGRPDNDDALVHRNPLAALQEAEVEAVGDRQLDHLLLH